MNDQKLWAEKMIERADERAEEAERELRTLLGRIEAWAAQAAINVEAQLTLPGGIDYERMVARVALLDAERISQARLAQEGRYWLAKQ